MPVTYKILAKQNVVYIGYTGVISVSETAEALAMFAQDPEAKDGLRHLVDFRQLTDMERNYFKNMELQALKAEFLANTGIETFMVYLANTPIGRRAANIGKNSWPQGCGVTAVIAENEQEVADFLGLPFGSKNDMLYDEFPDSARFLAG